MISNGHNSKSVQGIDISIVKLMPRNERKVAKKYSQRIEASLRAVGLIEPLIVFPVNDGYEILDGALRYRILLDLGVESVPCLIHNTRDGFTGNRMVNQPARRNGGWSKVAVVEAIRNRHRSGQSLIRTNREDRALYEAAKHWHGNWTAAMAAAGYPRPLREFYTADEVRLRIIDLYERQLPLTLQSQNSLKLRRSLKSL